MSAGTESRRAIAATSRRSLLGGALASAVLLVSPACQSLPPFTLEEAVRRLLYRSSERAFARLAAPDGYWDETVRRVGLPGMLGTRGEVVASILTSAIFKQRLEAAFADIALDASDRAAPVVTDAVRVIGISNAIALVNGGPRAATAYLRSGMGTRLVEAIVPEVGEAIRLAEDPLVGQLLAGLTGVDLAGLARNVAGSIEETIWREIGNEEAAIRADPAATRDPVLIGALGEVAS